MIENVKEVLGKLDNLIVSISDQVVHSLNLNLGYGLVTYF